MSATPEDYRLLMAEVYELAGASRRSSEEFARAQGLTVARWHVLSAVSDEALSVASIARRLGLTRQSVQRVVDDLAAAGAVTLRPDPADRRAPRLSLTPTGADQLSRVVGASQADRGAVLARSGLSTESLNEARTTLRTLLAALDPGAAGPSAGPPRTGLTDAPDPSR